MSFGLDCLDLRMRDLRAAKEEGRLSVHRVHLTRHQKFLHPPDPLEPCEFQYSRSIPKLCCESPPPFLTGGIDLRDHPLQQDRIRSGVDLRDRPDPRLVNISIGKMIQQLPKGEDAEFLLEEVGPQRTYALEILYRIGQYGRE